MKNRNNIITSIIELKSYSEIKILKLWKKTYEYTALAKIFI